ncbi:MAG: class II aldolase/adducin family protein, partial [Bacteroidaceae bacterium]|nr:class II aldolase/adducin family protein [Bacteroidaceae bacterium]
MLEQLKSQVLIAYQELARYGLDKYARGSVSAIDRETGLIVMKSAKDAFVVDMHGTILEGSSTPSSDVQSHIALYQA